MQIVEKKKALIISSSACCAALPILYYKATKEINKNEDNNNSGGKTISEIAKEGSKIKPPFPDSVRKLLSECSLVYLSTVDLEESSSHLSLMRFTYLYDEEDGEVVVMSTNRKTKKFAMLQKQKGVALLVHDFEQQQGGREGTSGGFSITLNGHCRIVTDEEKSEMYRLAHLERNPDYPQFIVGDDIAILCVDVKSARICNIHDQVLKWDVASSSDLVNNTKP